MKILTILSTFFILIGCTTPSELPKDIRPYRSVSDRNPILVHTFGADPTVLVYGGRVYLYMTGDTFEYDAYGELINNSYSKINTLRVISSADLANWTYHDPIPVAGRNGIATWAERSWAPDIVYKQVNGRDKFFLYFSNNANGIGVLTADDPQGTVLRNPGTYFNVTGNNHHTIFQFNDRWYITYHTQILEERMGVRGKGYRAPHIDYLTVSDGRFEVVRATRTGVSQIGNLNPYDLQKGATTGISAGLTFESECAIIKQNASWLGVYGADFNINENEGAKSLTFNARANENDRNVIIEVRLGDPTGNIIGTFNSRLTDSFADYSIRLTETINGIHDVYFIFRDGSLDFASWQFK